MELLGRMAGKGGSDILAAGTYSVSAGTLLKNIVAFEYAGADITISVVKDPHDQLLDPNFAYISDATPITSDYGLMVFPCLVATFTTDAVIKVWYA